MATKEKKREIVGSLGEFFTDGKVALVADLSGFTVAEISGFRRKLAADKARCRIAKNTLIKIATKSGDFQQLEGLTKGPSAIIVGYRDPVQPAKITVDYFKTIKKGSVRGAVLEGKVITGDEVKELAALPSKEQLLSSIMGGLDSGARGIAGCFEGVIRDIAVLVEEVAKKQQSV